MMFTKSVKVFQECFNKVLFCDFVVAWISSQLPTRAEGGLVSLYVIKSNAKEVNYNNNCHWQLTVKSRMFPSSVLVGSSVPV